MSRPWAPGAGGYRDQFIYNKALNLVIKALALSKRFPWEEKYGLTSQVRRAATSISSNIAEGYRRRTTREYIRYLTIAYGSCGELQSQTDIACEMRYITVEEHDAINGLEEEMSKLLWSAIETPKTKGRGRRNKEQGTGNKEQGMMHGIYNETAETQTGTVSGDRPISDELEEGAR